MYYKSALVSFHIAARPGEAMTSSELSNRILSSITLKRSTDPDVLKMFSKRSLSGDLYRLFRMGLMNRNRVEKSNF